MYSVQYTEIIMNNAVYNVYNTMYEKHYYEHNNTLHYSDYTIICTMSNMHNTLYSILPCTIGSLLYNVQIMEMHYFCFIYHSNIDIYC